MAEESTDSQSPILHLSLHELIVSESVDNLQEDVSHDYYVSADWSDEFYLLQALRGFIAVGYTTTEGQDFLLPQLQFSYCLLDFDRMHLSNKLKRSINELADWRLRVNHDISAVIRGISEYHPKSWLNASYVSLIRRLHEQGPLLLRDPIDNTQVLFHLCSIELYDIQNRLVAGELGYVIGRTYTSLTGYCERLKNFSIGKLQILALAKVLEVSGFAFMNLGQPPVDNLMHYKAEIGGFVFSRAEFLNRWKPACRETPRRISDFIHFDSRLADIF